ncbi:MAG: FmdB family zinc ribbon protein [Candidatus Limnocylindrales bacterium]
MPLYDYVCAACGHRVEVAHGIYDRGPAQCPNCHAHALRKAITAPAIVFKGSGWAKKDRGTASRRKAAAAAGGDRSADASKTAKSDSTTTTDSGGSPTGQPGSNASKGSRSADPAPASGTGSSD